MKKNYHKWLLRTVLALVCLLTTTSAWASFNIYVNSTSGDFYIYMWEGGSTNEWPGNKLNSYSTTTIKNKTWYVVPIAASSTKYILNNGNGIQTGDLSASSDIYLVYSGNNTATDVTNEMTNTPDVYYVRGNNEAFFGSNSWGNNDNVMTTTDETNYTWTSTGQATLSTDDVVEFKVVKNGSVWIGDNGSNITCTATQNGIYTLTVTYTVDGTPVGTLNLVETIPDRYYVVGEPSEVFPSGWSIGDQQLMTASGTTWTWTKSPIALAADATIAF